jgi:hypothetical protein
MSKEINPHHLTVCTHLQTILGSMAVPTRSRSTCSLGQSALLAICGFLWEDMDTSVPLDVGAHVAVSCSCVYAASRL